MEYRDVHTNKDVGVRLNQINNSSMSLNQKKDIEKYIYERKLGKFGAKAGKRRIANYLQFLNHIHNYFKKDLDKITEKEATKFYEDLMEDKIRKQNGLPYSNATKDEYIKSLKNYLSWKWGSNSSKFRKSVAWMRDTYKGSEKKAIILEQAEEITNKEPSIRNKAFFMFLFDSGVRIEEGLNVRLLDIQKVKRNGKGEFYQVHIRGQKTKNADRSIALPLCEKYLTTWLEEHPQREEDNFLFPINYDNGRKIIRIMSKKVLGYALKPHELRHSSATHWIQNFGADNITGFYYRFGWKFGSKVAEVYIKQYLFKEKGQEQLVTAVENGRVPELEKKIQMLEKVVHEQNMKYVADVNKLIPMIKKKVLEDLNAKEIMLVE